MKKLIEKTKDGKFSREINLQKKSNENFRTRNYNI